MKTRNVLLLIGMVLMSSAILFSGCKKKEDDPDPPTFVVTAQPTGDFLNFAAYCSTDDIALTKVTITDPLNNQYTYNAGGEIFVQDELIIFLDTYNKLFGTWRFTFVGTVTADGRSFTSTASIQVNGK